MAGLTEAEIAAVRKMIALSETDNWRDQLTHLLQRQSDVLSRITKVESEIAHLVKSMAIDSSALKSLADTMHKLQMTSGRREIFFSWLEKLMLVMIGVAAAAVAHSVGMQ